jgi:hypothetical protein
MKRLIVGVALTSILLSVPALTMVAGIAKNTSSAEAAGIDILQDNEPAAGYTITWTGETEAELWLNLKETRLTFERDFEIPVDPVEKNKAALTGKIELRATRRGIPGARTTVDQLRLKLKGPGHWVVDSEDVEATLTSAGLQVPEQQPQMERTHHVPLATWVKVGMAGFALFLGCAAWVKKKKQTQRARE